MPFFIVRSGRADADGLRDEFVSAEQTVHETCEAAEEVARRIDVRVREALGYQGQPLPTSLVIEAPTALDAAFRLLLSTHRHPHLGRVISHHAGMERNPNLTAPAHPRSR